MRVKLLQGSIKYLLKYEIKETRSIEAMDRKVPVKNPVYFPKMYMNTALRLVDPMLLFRYRTLLLKQKLFHDEPI